MKTKLKKILTSVLAASLLAGFSASIASFAAEGSPVDDYIAFQDESTGYYIRCEVPSDEALNRGICKFTFCNMNDDNFAEFNAKYVSELNGFRITLAGFESDVAVPIGFKLFGYQIYMQP